MRRGRIERAKMTDDEQLLKTAHRLVNHPHPSDPVWAIDMARALVEQSVLVYELRAENKRLKSYEVNARQVIDWDYGLYKVAAARVRELEAELLIVKEELREERENNGQFGVGA